MARQQDKIIAMFDDIAPSYDKANRMLSFGVDLSWRRQAIKKVYEHFPQKNLAIVDIACGTGDMLIEWEKIAKKNDKKLSLKGVDLSQSMLLLAQEKLPNCDFIKANACDLPLASESADIISISYGIRNVVERKKALKEFARVLKKGGVLLILEFTKRPKEGLAAYFRDFYLKYILPKLGGLISKNPDAYNYLQSSIEDFVSTKELCEELYSVNLELLNLKAYTMGICTQFIYKKA